MPRTPWLSNLRRQRKKILKRKMVSCKGKTIWLYLWSDYCGQHIVGSFLKTMYHCFIDEKWVMLVNSIGQVFYILFFIYFYQIEKVLLLSSYNYRCCYSFSFIRICFAYFEVVLKDRKTSWWIIPFIIVQYFSLSQIIFLSFEFYFDINVATQTFFLLRLHGIFSVSLYYF